MNQENLINLIGDLAEQVRLLRMKNTGTQKAVKQLQREENNTPQTELPHVVPRAPFADLIFFPELSEANPLAEEDFFRNQLTEEERKGMLYSFPKSNVMHYIPPALNDTASTAVKKVDTTLYEMRLLLADAASGITQSRRDLVYRTMELPGKVPKLNEGQDDSLFNSEEFDTVVEANRKARKRPVRSKGPFRQRQQVASGIAPTTAQNQQAVPTAPSSQSAGLRTNVNYASSSSQKKDAQSRKRFDNNRSSRTIIKARDRGSKKANSWFLQSLTHNPKKDWGLKTSTRLAKIKRTCSTTTFQNGIIDIDMQDDIEERLYDINRSIRCVPTYSHPREMQEIPEIPMEWENIPVQSASVRSFPQPFSLYQDTAPDNNLGTSLGNKDCVLFGRHHNIGEKPTNMPEEHQYSSIKAQRTRISDQGLKIISCTKTDHQTPGNAYQLQADDSESSNRQGSRLEKGGIQIDNQGGNYTKRTSFIHWEGTNNGCSTTPRTPNVEEIVGTEKQSLVKNIRLELSSVNKGQCTAESDLVERSTTSMEWSLIHSRSSGIGHFYRCKRHCMGDSCGIPILLRTVDSIRDIPPYKRKRIISDIKGAMSYECCGEICLDLFRQHHVDFVHQKTWRYYFSKIIKSFRTNMVTLSQNRYPSPNDVCPYIPQSCRCAKQTNCTNGMGHFKVNFQPNILEVWKPRRRSICLREKRTPKKLLQLVSRQKDNRPQCTIAQLDSLEQPILLSTVESDYASNTEDPQRETDSNVDNANVDFCNMVSRSDKVNDQSANIIACNSNNSGPKKRKIATIRQQEMMSSNMVTQRSSLKDQGYYDAAIRIMVSNQRSVKRPTNLLSLKDLTEKTCWLLAVCVFMRASDMHRIDDVRTTLSDTSVCFVIVAPKEKRQGRPIERPCEIKAHNNKLMCPVDAYRIYKQKVANVPCTSPHVNKNDIIINHLFRYIKDNSKPLSVDSISRNIKSITKLIVTNGKQIPKARAIGATLAASAGISSDVIIFHAFWSGYDMLDNYYRLSRERNINITESIISLK
ncbi:hypothetical protein AYI70_g4345 [Smittium culicis]|uniref:Uncharacterized protein n=1 Tax=Smittium culicis TaxID=133412 RepID=A0A1R1XZR1_9FUNG|nr:hypothetical protein AYI70_g4345 [Smittium culicis]